MKNYYQSGDEFLDDYVKYLGSLGDELTDIFCVTYNLYSAIKNWKGTGEEKSLLLPPPHKISSVQKYITICNSVNGLIIFNEENSNEDININKQKWPNVKWYRHKYSHTKIYISRTRDGKLMLFLGSANLSNSDWHDSVAMIKENDTKKDIIKHYMLILSESAKV